MTELRASTVGLGVNLTCCDRLAVITTRLVQRSDTSDSGGPCLRMLIERDDERDRLWARMHARQHGEP